MAFWVSLEDLYHTFKVPKKEVLLMMMMILLVSGSSGGFTACIQVPGEGSDDQGEVHGHGAAELPENHGALPAESGGTPQHERLPHGRYQTRRQENHHRYEVCLKSLFTRCVDLNDFLNV